MWFSGFFLHSFLEIFVFFRVLAESETIGNYTYVSELGINLYANQSLYGLYLCVAVIFLINCASYIFKRKRIYAVFAAANIFLFCLFMIFAPDMTELLLSGSENALDIAGFVFVRQIGILTLMLNMFASGLYELYSSEEKQ